MTPSSDRGYALDLLSAVRHVATKLEEARLLERASSIEALMDYRASNGDLSRIKHHELHDDDATDEEATRWLIEKAITELNGRLEEVDGGLQLKDELAKFRYQGKRIHPFVDAHKQLRDPFHPLSGEFSENIGIASKRMDRRDSSLAELRDSLDRFGWLEECPGFRDERGVIIVGHRRWALCDELDIPEEKRVMKKIVYGDGDEADRRRMIAAVQSNVGIKEFTREEWKHIARYLRAKGETIEAIAKELDKPISTVGLAVEDFPSAGKSSDKGRPRNLSDQEQQKLIELHFEEGKSIHEAEAIARGWDEPKARPTQGAIKTIDQERGARRRDEEKGRLPAMAEDAPSSKACTCPCPVHGAP